MGSCLKSHPEPPFSGVNSLLHFREYTYIYIYLYTWVRTWSKISSTLRPIDMEAKNHLNWKGKSSSQPPFLGSSRSFSRVYMSKRNRWGWSDFDLLIEVNVDGLKRGADSSTTISVQTLFTRTLRSLMFDNVPWFPFVGKQPPKRCGLENFGGVRLNVWIYLLTFQETCFIRALLCEMFWFEQNWVVVSNIFYFHPYLGKIPIFD